MVRYIEAISLFKFKSVKSSKKYSSLAQYVEGFQRFHAGAVTPCKFLLVSYVIGLFRRSLGRVTEHEEELSRTKWRSQSEAGSEYTS